jgi:hypothetical protein
MLGTSHEYSKVIKMKPIKVQLNLEIGDLVTSQRVKPWLGVVISHHRDHKGQRMVKVKWNSGMLGQYYNWHYANDPDEGLVKVSA